MAQLQSQVDATDAASIALYGYKAETINSRVHGTVDAQAIADRYIDQRAYPIPAFQSITFPITNSEIDDADRDDLLAVFMGMPVHIQTYPPKSQVEILKVMLRAGLGALGLMNCFSQLMFLQSHLAKWRCVGIQLQPPRLGTQSTQL
jgi:hypothetical protein